MSALVHGARLEPLAPHTSFRIGGPADAYLLVRTTDDLLEAVAAARERELPVFLLGGGTNILVADRGIRGLVLHHRVNDVRVEGTRITATGGVTLAHLAAVAARNDIAGLEFAATIPGTVGGAVHGNAGAWGSETKDVLGEVALADLNGEVRMAAAEALDMSYRRTVLQGTPLIVLQATFVGRPGRRAEIVRRIKDIANERLAKQPLDQPNTGSVFKNPPKDHAGRLVEAVGGKELRIGGAVVSPKHANFIVNTGGASAADVRALIEELVRRVRGQFGVTLEPEVEFVGEWDG